MNPQRLPHLYIKDMLKYINKIERFTKGLNYDKFIKDEKTIQAVINCIVTLGEASFMIPPNIKEIYNEICWADIVSTRNRIVHGYFDINYQILWETIKTDIPELKSNIKKIMRDLDIKCFIEKFSSFTLSNHIKYNLS